MSGRALCSAWEFPNRFMEMLQELDLRSHRGEDRGEEKKMSGQADV